jgi:hypothetical protein
VDRIERIPPRPPATEPVMPVRRSEGATERERDAAERRRKQREKPRGDEPPPPEDDGRPHVDVRV